MTLDADRTRALAAELHDAAASATPLPPLTETEPGLDVGDAYRIQQDLVRRYEQQGQRVAGYKVGLTSAAMQRQLGVTEPDYAPVLSGMVHSAGARLRAADLIAPRVEAEIAFVLDGPLRGPGVTPLDVARSTRGVVASLEVIDSRIADWRIALPDTVADLASCAAVVLGARLVPLDGLDLRRLGVVVEVNGRICATGAGAAALGDPTRAVAWAANTLGALGTELHAGAFVMPGAVHAAVPMNPGDHVRARFGHLGDVDLGLDA